MQPMADALAVLGSRHGIVVDPIHRACGIVRYDRFDHLQPLHLRAGVIIDGVETILPLAPDGQTFDFHDQRQTPCTLSLTGVHARAALKIKLTIATPFRPRDATFSTTPVLGLRLEAAPLHGNFRWAKHDLNPAQIGLFVEFSGPQLSIEEHGADTLDLRFASQRFGKAYDGTSPVPQHDRIVAVSGSRVGRRFTQRVDLAVGRRASTLDLAWCTFDAIGLRIQGTEHPFRYARTFKGLDDVARWARTGLAALFANARAVDRVVAQNDCGQAVNHLLACSLHAWLIDTWYIDRGGRDWFSVWEGNCYFHSTVDVEFTQAPFYLSVWPELLGLELDQWAEYAKDGETAIGDRGSGSSFLSHDIGSGSCADGQAYHHEMEVEESGNYVILAYAHWRRTGSDRGLKRHADTIERFLRFIAACDTTGNGVPTLGVANTIDDASPAVQFGKQQIYLAVKALVAFQTGAIMMAHLQRPALAKTCRALARKIRAAIREKGWAGDHFVTLLDKRGEGLVNPWTHETLNLKAVPGWDAAHIYTANALAIMDMLGVDSGLDARRLKTDLKVATARCLTEYGCVHSDFGAAPLKGATSMESFAGVARNPGWISMNMLRDMAAFYRGIDLRPMSERYWSWQTTTNAQEPKIFFETFAGNNLCFYPRGVAVWGFFEALAGQVIDRVAGVDRTTPAFTQIRVPRLFDANWRKGSCRIVEH